MADHFLLLLQMHYYILVGFILVCMCVRVFFFLSSSNTIDFYSIACIRIFYFIRGALLHLVRFSRDIFVLVLEIMNEHFFLQKKIFFCDVYIHRRVFL